MSLTNEKLKNMQAFFTDTFLNCKLNLNFDHILWKHIGYKNRRTFDGWIDGWMYDWVNKWMNS